MMDFPLTPEAIIRNALAQHHRYVLASLNHSSEMFMNTMILPSRLYTPTHAYLTKMYADAQSGIAKLPFTSLSKARKSSKIGRANDEALLKELRFMHHRTGKVF